ncbi:MAG TPA: glutamate 5-kinase [Chthoniobacteraceae bacterium]|nr:glutamate 5-kinase [Chthoniobacteraceae bacterium]
MSTKPKRIVFKFGTGILTRPDTNTIDDGQIKRLSAEVAALARQGHECLIVSSGAVGAGLMVLGRSERPCELIAVQACAAVGQGHLMKMYGRAFDEYGLHVAQLLLTHSDLDSHIRHTNAGNTLEWLLRQGDVVPIINENDSVAVEELRFGDNDQLSAEVARMVKADLLVLLTTAHGLMNGDRVVPEVRDVDAVLDFVQPTKGKYSIGGMASKLQAVKKALRAGIRTVIATGRQPGVIDAVVHGDPHTGTRFYPSGGEG